MSVISKEISCLNYGDPNDYGSVLLAICQVCSFMCGKIVIKTEFKIHVWCVHRKRQTAVSSLWLEVRGFVTFSFFRSKSAVTWKKKSTWALPSWITQRMGVLHSFIHFNHKMWRKDWFSSVPNGLVIKKRLQFTYYRTCVRTFEQEEKKRQGNSTSWNCLARSSNVDGKRRTWPLESGHVTLRRLRSHVVRNKRGSKTPRWFS